MLDEMTNHPLPPAPRHFRPPRLRPMKTLLIAGCMAFIWSAGAAELRTWMSVKGTTLEAKLVRYDPEKEEVYLSVLKPKPRELKLKASDLSLADRQHLVEYAKADPKILTAGDLEVPEEDVRIDKATFERLDKKLSLTGATDPVFDLMRTEHFLVAYCGKVRPNSMAEIAERLWHGSAFHHMDFRVDWGDERMLIVLVDGEDVFKHVGDWYKKHLADAGFDQQANRIGMLWDKLQSTTIRLPDEVVEEHKVFDHAPIFNVKDRSRYRKVFAPFPTHGIAGRILARQIGGITDYGQRGYFAIVTGHAYYKEIQLAGKTETRLIDADAYEGNEIAQARGFEDGTSWARSLRKMVRRGKLEPKLEPLLAIENAVNLTPEQLVMIYSFAYYMQSTPERVSAFATLVRRAAISNQIPASIEIARIFGFKSVEALEKDWIEFIESRDFK